MLSIRARVFAGVAVTAGLCVPSAMGGLVHPTTMHVQVSDGFNSGVFLPGGTDEGDGVFNYRRGPEDPYSGGDGEWNMEWDFNAIPFDEGNASIAGNFVVRNNSPLETLDFSIVIAMPLLFHAEADNFYAGSAAITISQGTLAALPGDMLWSALIDGSSIAGLFAHPFTLTGPDDANDVTVGLHPGADDSIGLRIAFSLTPGADMTITSGMGIQGAIPAPGALAFFGLVGLLGGRRRR